MSLSPGARLGPYEIVSALGAGGMGEVYRARDPRLAREVAIKILPTSFSADPDRVRRFEQEARAAGMLNHPNITAVYDTGTIDGSPYVVSELLEGETLRDRLAAGPLSFRKALDYAIQVARGLAAAHGKGIVHRDLKPENLFVTNDGRVKILDFGLAKLTQPEEVVARGSSIPTATPGTEPGVVLGTAGYMSPEQVRGQTADSRSDIFSFGAILHEMLSGKRAFPGQTAADTMSAILREDPPDLSGNVPPSLDRLRRHCLEKNAEERLHSAHDLAFELEAIAETPTSAWRAAPERGRRPPVAVLLVAAALLLVAVGSFWLLRNRDSSRKSSARAGHTTIAVLPFQNLGADRRADFLRLALPDEIVTTLSFAPALAIRPFAATRKYEAPNVDPQSAGEELRVDLVLTGHFLREGDRLQVTLEVTETETNQVAWRDTLTGTADDLIGLQQRVSARLSSGLGPLLSSGSTGGGGATRPRNPEAYDLYLRSAATSRDPGPNDEGIRMLERAVALDPNYAPAWAGLSDRYHQDAQFGGGGEESYERARTASERALALDPDLSPAARRLVVMRVEAGEIESAWDDAARLVERRPNSGDAHFTLGYVLRYAGLLEEAARECDVSLSLDPGNPRSRSCGIPFLYLGRFNRTMTFANLDAGSQFSESIAGWVDIYQGRFEEASRRKTVGFSLEGSAPYGEWLRGCLMRRPPAAPGPLPPDALAPYMAARDPEARFSAAAELALCGEKRAALRLLRKAVERNYCGYPAMDTIPLFAAIRGTPEFAEIRRLGIACQQRFLAHRAAKDGAPAAIPHALH